MASEIQLLRLTTGEDVIGKITKNENTITIEKGCVLVPRQQAPGQPVTLMLTPYAPYSETNKIDINKDVVVSFSKPKKDIQDTYIKSTSTIVAPNKQLITETGLPTLGKK